MSEDWNSLLKDLVVGVCAIFVIVSALARATSYGIYTYNNAIDYEVENIYLCISNVLHCTLIFICCTTYIFKKI